MNAEVKNWKATASGLNTSECNLQVIILQILCMSFRFEALKHSVLTEKTKSRVRASRSVKQKNGGIKSRLNEQKEEEFSYSRVKEDNIS